MDDKVRINLGIFKNPLFLNKKTKLPFRPWGENAQRHKCPQVNKKKKDAQGHVILEQMFWRRQNMEGGQCLSEGCRQGE